MWHSIWHRADFAKQPVEPTNQDFFRFFQYTVWENTESKTVNQGWEDPWGERTSHSDKVWRRGGPAEMTGSWSCLIKTHAFFVSFELLMERWIRAFNVKGSQRAVHISQWHFELWLNWKPTPGVSAHSGPHQPPVQDWPLPPTSNDLVSGPECLTDTHLVLITYQSKPQHTGSRCHIHCTVSLEGETPFSWFQLEMSGSSARHM